MQRERAEAEFAAVLGERNRIAREIHDTLTQDLGAISLHIEVAENSWRLGRTDVAEHLQVARQLARSSLAESRNSIWNMRSQVLETGDLASALSRILENQALQQNVQLHAQVAGESYRLPPAVENDVLRIGQEAVINAVKHAQARNIRLELQYTDQKMCMTVSDDGRGFNVSARAPGADGFGLTCMQERAAAIQAELEVSSEPGQGCKVRLTVPTFGKRKQT